MSRVHPRGLRRTALLVVSVALTVAVGMPESVSGVAADAGPSADQGTLPATSGLATAAHTTAVSDLVAVDRNRTLPPVGADGTPQRAPASAGPTAGCDTGAVTTAATTRVHRDDVAAHPEALAGGCRLAGPKRFHGATDRPAATVDLPLAKPATTSTVAAAARWSGRFNLYRKTAFVTQKDFKWCVAASVQMMVNLVRHRSDRTAATQKRVIRYAQASDDGPYGPGGGTDVTGWIAALRHFGAGKYRAVGARTAAAALRIAATAMRQTGRPAGMLVMEGRHAWILHGFESRTDPEHDRRARITSVRVSGPLYPVQQKNGYDLRPNTELSVRALARYFQPSSVGALVGKYVVIVPSH